MDSSIGCKLKLVVTKAIMYFLYFKKVGRKGGKASNIFKDLYWFRGFKREDFSLALRLVNVGPNS